MCVEVTPVGSQQRRARVGIAAEEVTHLRERQAGRLRAADACRDGEVGARVTTVAILVACRHEHALVLPVTQDVRSHADVAGRLADVLAFGSTRRPRMTGMDLHLINCGTLHPPSSRLVNGSGGAFARASLTCNCLLVAQGGGDWALVDTGIGTADLADPATRLGRGFVRINRPRLDPAETAIARVSALGIDPRRVTDIVLTHHDTDHVGGIVDFPWARVHASAAQVALVAPALEPRFVDRLHPVQWAHGPRWSPVQLDRDHGYAGRPAARISDRIRLVALDGHIDGHCGVVVHREGAPDVVHVGDAIFALRTLDGRATPLGRALFERRMRTDAPAWRRSREWVRNRHRDGAVIVCGHDPDAVLRRHGERSVGVGTDISVG